MRRFRAQSRSARLVAAFACALLQVSTSASAQTANTPSSLNAYGETGNGPPVDPARCKTGDKRFVYWAARDQVFRFRFDPSLPLYPRTGRDGEGGQAVMGYADIPPAAVPGEPEGCEGNPLRGGAVPYMRGHGAALFRRLAGREINLATDARPWGHGYFALPRRLDGQDDNRRYAEWFRGKRACWTHASGIVECMDGTKPDPADFRSAHVLKIEGRLVAEPATPAPEALYVLLGRDAQTDLSRDKNGFAVQGGFDLYGSVRLLDTIRLFPAEIDLLVPYYRGLIQYLHQAHVPGYRWAVRKTS